MSYAKLDPEQKSKTVTGWWRLGSGIYAAHSVVERDGGLMCITPHHHLVEAIEFARDPDIEWVDDGERWQIRFRGEALPRVLRGDPESTIAHAQEAIKRLNTMKNPYEAIDF